MLLKQHASPFSGTAGGPPKTGQFFIAIAPSVTAGDGFANSIATLAESIRSQNGAHLPGDKRRDKRLLARKDGVAVNIAILEKIESILK